MYYNIYIYIKYNKTNEKYYLTFPFNTLYINMPSYKPDGVHFNMLLVKL